jgi:hypothetical protein
VEAGSASGLPCFIADQKAAWCASRRRTRILDGLWLLTHPDLRHSARVRAFLDFTAAEIAKLRKLLEGTLLPEASSP